MSHSHPSVGAARPTSGKKVYPRDSVRLFRSDFLESFTHVHPLVPALIWVPACAVLMVRSFTVHHLALPAFLGIGAGALLVWTLVEYCLHRFAFHFPAKSAAGKRFVYIMHGLHHDDPADPTRLVMPPLPAILYALLLFPVFRAITGPRYAEAFIAFFMVGYLAYDYTHYYVHHFVPRSRVGKFLKRYHMIHHYSDHDAKWGVSNPLWDHVFGTTTLRAGAKSALARKNAV